MEITSQYLIKLGNDFFYSQSPHAAYQPVNLFTFLCKFLLAEIIKDYNKHHFVLLHVLFDVTAKNRNAITQKQIFLQIYFQKNVLYKHMRL